MSEVVETVTLHPCKTDWTMNDTWACILMELDRSCVGVSLSLLFIYDKILNRWNGCLTPTSHYTNN
jgi:hypothetical protein